MSRQHCTQECLQGRYCTCYEGGQPWGILPLLAALAALVIVLATVGLVLIVKGVA